MLAKFARKTWSSLSTSTKSWPWVAWTIMIVSNILRMLESPEVEGGGLTTAIGSTYSSIVGSLKKGGGGATLKEDSIWGRLELALIWVALCLRKVAPMGAIKCTGSETGKSSKPKCNKIWWIKIRKNRPCAVKLLLWTSTKDRIKRVGKFIGASVTRAYKNAHLSIGMMGKWEIGQMEWQEIRKNK